MELYLAADRIWYSAYEEERDRPCLGYIRGNKFSVAVDAGHSDEHVREFYEALERENLPLPALTVITHWHWDHAFGMHKVHGMTVANERTNRHLMEFAEQLKDNGPDYFLSMDPSIRKEYPSGKTVIITPADVVFHEKLTLDPGGIRVQLLTCNSPHTDDTTLVFVPEEKILFVGDCISGVFPTWERDPVKTAELIDTLRDLDADHCIGGHWPVFDKGELLEALMADEMA